MGRRILWSVVLVLVLGVAATAAGPVLWGSWETTVTIDPSQPSFADAISLLSLVTVGYGVGDWLITSIAGFTEDGWASLLVETEGRVGAFDFWSDMQLNPDGTFVSAHAWATVSFAAVEFTAFGSLAGGDAWLVLFGEYVGGAVTSSFQVSFGDPDETCNLPFSLAVGRVSWTFCCADVTVATIFTCTGLSQAGIWVTDIMVPTLPWLSLDANLLFTLGVEGGKTLMLSPTFDFGDTVCFDVYFDVAHTLGLGPVQTLDFLGIEVEGLGIVCDIGGVTFEGTSYWGDPRPVTYTDWDGEEYTVLDFPGVLRGYGQAYWEGYRITTNDDGCCGPFWFSATALFGRGVIHQLIDAVPVDYNGWVPNGGISLFDLDVFDFLMRIRLSAQFAFTTGLTIDVGHGVRVWTIGFMVTWGNAPKQRELEPPGPWGFATVI